MSPRQHMAMDLDIIGKAQCFQTSFSLCSGPTFYRRGCLRVIAEGMLRSVSMLPFLQGVQCQNPFAPFVKVICFLTQQVYLPDSVS